MPKWTFKILDHLPHPPKELLDSIDFSTRPEQVLFDSQSNTHVEIKQKHDWKEQGYNWIQPMASNKNKRHHFNEEFLLWIKNNITSDFEEKNSGIMFFDEPQLPHTDVTRDYVLLYNVLTGGDEATVCFWHEENCELMRERMQTAKRSEKLLLIDSLKGPKGQWYLMNTRILHSVENVTNLRVNLQISFNNQFPQSLIKE